MKVCAKIQCLDLLYLILLLGFFKTKSFIKHFSFKCHKLWRSKKTSEVTVAEQTSAKRIEFEDLFICSAKCVSFNNKSVKNCVVSLYQIFYLLIVALSHLIIALRLKFGFKFLI